MKFQHLLFDLDGTLIDSGAGIISSVRYALSKCNRDDYDVEGFTDVIGPPLLDSFQKKFY